MRIAVLGPLEVRGDDDEPVPVPGAKERLLLAVLAAGAPGAVPADRIADVLWDGAPPPTARKSLQAHVVRLRSALEPCRPRGSPGRYVARRGPGYALTAERSGVDALALGDLAARGRAALAAGDPAAAAAQLAAALALWRGDPYADWPDAAFAAAERRRLTELRDGVLTALAEARLALGEAAALVPDLERLVTDQPLREEWWRLLVLALYRAGRQADALGAARRARAVLAEELGADPGPALRAIESAVLAQDPALDPLPVTPEVPSLSSGACPYLGLRAYRAEDAALFAGRERLVATLVARLVDAPLLAVSGPSGAGKSSVVRAGLVPALAAGALPGSPGWRLLVLLPGRRPADVLADLTGEDPPPDPVLLVCDQFEELWAPGVDPAERAAFLDALLALLDDGVVARCVAVVRGDAVGRLAEHPGFVDRLGGALVLVPPMTDPELRAVVRQPAAAVGLRVEDDLVDAVVADGLGRPGALPLLSSALVGTWEGRRGDLLTLAGYAAAGGVAGALARSAEAAYGALDGPGRERARRLFVRLADTGDAGALVRRPVPLPDLGPDGTRDAVVAAFLARRLLSVDADRLEVTHEALLTAWPRLARWLEDDAAGRAVRRHLSPAARDWDAAGRPDDELYRGARLSAALDWAAGAGEELTPVEHEFLAASRGHVERDLAAAREQARREVRRRRRTRRLAVGLAAALVVALVAGALTLRAQREATRASLVADANRLAALSTTAGTLDVSLLLAAQAQRLGDTPETQDALLGALSASPRARRVVPLPGRVLSAELTGGGRSLFAGVGHELVAWPVERGGPPRTLFAIPDRWSGWQTLDGSPVDDAMVVAGHGPDGSWVEIADGDGHIRPLLRGPAVGGIPLAVGFTGDGAQVQLLEATSQTADTTDWALVLVDAATGASRSTPVGGTVAAPVEQLDADVADDDPGTAVVWARDPPTATLVDLRSGAQAPVQWQQRDAEVRRVLALASGTAQLWDDGSVWLYDRAGRPVQLLTAHPAPVRDVVLSPDGGRAVTVGEGGAVVLWDVDPATGRWDQRESLAGHGGDVVDADVDATGTRLFTASVDDTLVQWDLSPDGEFGGWYPPLAGRYIANRPQLVGPDGPVVAPTRPVGAATGNRVYAAEDTLDVAATFLDPGTGRVVAEVPVGVTLIGASSGSSVSVSPDGRHVAVTSGLAATVLDTRSRRVVETLRLPALGDVGDDGAVLPAEVVWCAGWTPDGTRLLLGAEGRLDPAVRDGGLVVVDTGTWAEVGRVEIGAPQSIEASPDGRVLAVALDEAAEIVVLDADTLEVLHTVVLPDDSDQVLDLSFSPDGRWLAAGGVQGRLHLLDAETWHWTGEPVTVHDNFLLQVEWLPDGTTVVTAGGDGRVSLFDTARRLVRAEALPASAETGEGFAHLVPATGSELTVLSGERPGRRYPLDPSAWLDRACAVAGRDLDAAEWERYLPGRAWQPTCTDL